MLETFVVQMCIFVYFNFMRWGFSRQKRLRKLHLADGTAETCREGKPNRPRKLNKELRFSPSINFTLTFHIELLHFFVFHTFNSSFSLSLALPVLQPQFISTAFSTLRRASFSLYSIHCKSMHCKSVTWGRRRSSFFHMFIHSFFLFKNYVSRQIRELWNETESTSNEWTWTIITVW